MSNNPTSNASMSKEERLRLRLYSERRHDGGDPSQLLELLAVIIEERIWERLADEETGQPMTFRTLIETPWPAGVGMKLEHLETYLKLPHKFEHQDPAISTRMQALRQEAKRLLHPPLMNDEEWMEAKQEGGAKGGRGHVAEKPTLYYNVGLEEKEKQGTSSAYALRRLQRDRPDLAEQVIMGEKSANEAAIEAGFRQKTITIPVEPTAAARRIRNNFTDEQVAELIALLIEQR